jgi:hypothetical protein
MEFDLSHLDILTTLDCDYADQFKTTLKKIKNDIPDNFPTIPLHNDWGPDISHVFVRWRQGEKAPTLPILLLNAAHHFDLDTKSDLFISTMAACILGEIPHQNPYHNNLHFLEVFYVAMHLCALHNDLSREDNLSKDEVLLLLLAAAIHDFAHPGHGNMLNDTHIPSFVEKKSLTKIEPFLKALGLSDALFKQVQIMIICTDVSRDSNGKSPSMIARDIYLSHQHNNLKTVNVPDFFKPLLDDKKLPLMAVMLCEADIAMSSGLDYEFSKEMTRLVAQESSILQPNAVTLLGFMESICHGGYLTHASNNLLGQNFQAILLQAEQDAIESVSYAKPHP